MTRIIPSLFALALVAALTAERARADNQLSISVANQYVGDSGVFATGASSDVVSAELVYARGVARLWRGVLWVEGAASLGTRKNHVLASLDTSALLTGYTLGVRYSVPIPRAPWLVPRLRIGAGALAAELSIDDGLGRRASGWSGAFTSYAMLGIEILLPRRWMWQGGRGVTGGVAVEGGWIQSTALDFTLGPDADPTLRQLATTGVDLGALTMSGPILRVGATIQF